MKSLLFLVFVGLAYGAPGGRAGLCEVCHLLVGEVQDLVTTGHTQKTITSYVENICSKLPSEEKDVCHSFMTENSKIIFSQLAHDLTPHDFCMKLEDVCPSQEQYDESETEAADPSANPLECELCKLAVLGIDKLIGQNKSEAAINATLEKLCDGLPDQLSDICRKIEPLILKGITSGLEPSAACKVVRLCAVVSEEGSAQMICEVCHAVMSAIGVQDTGTVCVHQRTCQEEIIEEPVRIVESVQETPVETVELELKGTIECQICKFAVQAVDHLLGENRTVAAINSTLMQVCDGLPGELKDSCLNVEPDILNAILGGIDPSKACDFLKICNDATKGFTQISCDACKETMDAVAGEEGISFCYKFEDICGAEDNTEEKNVDADAKCDLCEFVVQLLDEVLASGETIDKLNDTLIEICKVLPDQVKTICMSLVPQIDNIIKAGVDPKAACIAIQYCPQTEQSPVLTDDMKCELCSKMSQALPTKLASTVKAGVCIEVCHERQRRSTLKKLGQMIRNTKVKGLAECELCHVIIRSLDNLVGENATLEQVNNTVYDICYRLTGQQLIDVCLQEAPKLVPILKDGLDPIKICIEVKLCTQESKTLEKSIEVQKTVTNVKDTELPTTMESPLLKAINKKTRQNVGDLKCEMCEAVVEMLDKYIQDNETDQKINETLYQLCTSLPDGELKDLCLQEEPAIMYALGEGLDPKATCQKATLCAEAKDLSLSDVTSDNSLLQYLNQKMMSNVGDLKCDICEGAVKLVDSYIENNATIEQINETLYRICSGLPDGAFKDICNEQVPAIMKIIESGGFDPEKVCTAAGLCDVTIRSTKMKKVAKIVPKASSIEEEEDDVSMAENSEVGNLKDLKCTVCEAVIQEIDSLVGQNETIAKINETIYSVCSKLTGALNQLCLQAAPQILQAIEAGADPQETCTKIGLCSSIDDITVDIDPINVGDIKCDICELLIEGIDRLVKNNATDDKINTTIYNLCGQLPGTAQKYCLNVAPTVVQTIESGADPAKACAELKLCTSQYEVKSSQLGDIKCDICELLIDEIDKYIGNASAPQINATVYEICGKLPTALQSTCIQMAPTIVKELENGVDPKEACTKLKLCAGRAIEMEAEPISSYQVDLKCDVCEFLISEMDKILVDNTTDAKINASIFSVCNKLSGTALSICLSLAPGLVKNIEAGLDPNSACVLLTLCPSSENEVEAEPVFDYQVDIKCDVCEFLISEMDKILVDNATDAKINASIFAVCGKLSGTARLICISLAPGLVNDIKAGLNPNTLCVLLTLCPGSEKTEAETNYKVDIKCDVCEFLISEMDKILVDNATDAKINASIFAVCGKLSGTARLICISLAPGLVNDIKAGLNPNTLCVLLTLCPGSEKTEAETNYKVDIKCDVCEFLISEMDKILVDNATDAKINASIFSVCGKLSGTALLICRNLAPGLVQSIEAGLDPTKACVLLTFCPRTEEIEVENSEITSEYTAETLDCGMCRRSLQTAYDEVDEMKLQSLLLNLCDNMPLAYKQQCENLIEVYGGKYLKMILQHYTPTNLCELARCFENGEPTNNGSY